MVLRDVLNIIVTDVIGSNYKDLTYLIENVSAEENTDDNSISDKRLTISESTTYRWLHNGITPRKDFLALIIKALLKEISRIGKIQKAKEAIDNYILHCPYFTREFKENLDTRYEDNFDEYFKDIIEIAYKEQKRLKKGSRAKNSIQEPLRRDDILTVEDCKEPTDQLPETEESSEDINSGTVLTDSFLTDRKPDYKEFKKKIMFFSFITVVLLLTTSMLALKFNIFSANTKNKTTPFIYTGSWSTNFFGDRVSLKQNGDVVEGNYNYKNGKIYGRVIENKVVGTWKDSDNYGDIEIFSTDKGKTIVLKWRYGSKGDWNHNWKGIKNKFDGSWLIDESGHLITLKQAGDNVIGEYGIKDLINGNIAGRVKNNTMIGTWEDCYGWGNIEITLSEDYNKIFIKWMNNENETWNANWSGKRIETETQ